MSPHPLHAPHTIFHWLILIDKKLWQWQHSSIILHLFDLRVKGQSYINVMMVHNILPNGDASIYQISLTYLERQINYCPYKFLQLFDIGVEDQGQINYVMMVHDTSSNGHVPIYQISLTYFERQKKLRPGQVLSIIWPWDQRSRSNECHNGMWHTI